MNYFLLFLTVFALRSGQAQVTIPIEWQQNDPSLKIDIFRCYLSKFEFLYEDGSSRSFPENVFLVDLEDSSSWNLRFNAPQSTLQSIRFTVGTDSVLNVSGVYYGALDPLKGMYWAWNTGYINLKIEGKYNEQVLEYHVGGYRSPFATDRTHEIKFNGGTQKIVLSPDAFVQKALEAKLHSIMIPGKDAALLADQYYLLFVHP